MAAAHTLSTAGHMQSDVGRVGEGIEGRGGEVRGRRK